MTTNLTKNRLREFLPSQWSDVDSLVNQFFGPQIARSLSALPHTGSAWTNAGSAWEDEENYHIEMDVPGVDREDVELTYDQGELRISAERKAPERASGPTDQRRYGKVVYTLSLPETIDPDTIDASLEQGVLHVTVAKKPEAQPKRIEVK
jgi:HSP20 family protein